MSVSIKPVDFDQGLQQGQGQQSQTVNQTDNFTSQPQSQETYKRSQTQQSNQSQQSQQDAYNQNIKSSNQAVEYNTDNSKSDGVNNAGIRQTYDNPYDVDTERNIYYQQYRNEHSQPVNSQGTVYPNQSSRAYNRNNRNITPQYTQYPQYNRYNTRTTPPITRRFGNGIRTTLNRVRVPNIKVIIAVVVAFVALIAIGLFNSGNSGKATLRVTIAKLLTFDNFCWLVIIVVCIVIMTKFYRLNRRRR